LAGDPRQLSKTCRARGVSLTVDCNLSVCSPPLADALEVCSRIGSENEQGSGGARSAIRQFVSGKVPLCCRDVSVYAHTTRVQIEIPSD
jgi:hypothetical protein